MKKIIDFLSSMKLAIYLLIILSVMAILGSIIPQEQPAEFYAEKYPEMLNNIIQLLLLNDIWHSLYFYAVSLFLVVSIITCTLRRLNGIISIYKRKNAVDEKNVRNARLFAEKDKSASQDELVAAFKKSGYRAYEAGDGVIAHRNRWAKFGEILFHFGLVLLVVGAIGRSFGVVTTVNLFEGQTYFLGEELDPEMKIECLEVVEERDPNTGVILDYKTKVKISKIGNEPVTKILEVNDPLEFGGINFYQSSMASQGMTALKFTVQEIPEGESPEIALTAGIKVLLRQDGVEQEMEIIQGEMAPLGDTGYFLIFQEYFSNFNIGYEGMSNDNPESNPALAWILVDQTNMLVQGISFVDSPDPDMLKYSDVSLEEIGISVRFLQPPADIEEVDYIVPGGVAFPLGGGRYQADLSFGETHGMEMDFRTSSLILTDQKSGEDHIFPFAEKISFTSPGGNQYIIRFLGEGSAPYSGLTASKDPGLGFFYAGSLILTFGILIAMLIRHETIQILPKSGKLLISGRTNKKSDLFSDQFENKVDKIISNLK